MPDFCGLQRTHSLFSRASHNLANTSVSSSKPFRNMVPALKECNKDHVLFSDCKSSHNVV